MNLLVNISGAFTQYQFLGVIVGEGPPSVYDKFPDGVNQHWFCVNQCSVQVKYNSADFSHILRILQHQAETVDRGGEIFVL